MTNKINILIREPKPFSKIIVNVQTGKEYKQNRAEDAKSLAKSPSFFQQIFRKSEETRLTEQFATSIKNISIEPKIVPIIESRLAEVDRTFGAKAYLSSVVMCGSILEAVLLGQAEREPEKFNRSKAAPKTTEGKIKQFCDWKLADLIDVARELGILRPDAHKFSHYLRDFRNYIHPNQQMQSGFMPDKHTARMCVDALRAALACIAGER